jgi:putative membrane protein
MAKALVHFLLIVGVFLLLTHAVPGFYLRDWGAAVIAALVFGLVNATLGLVLKIITFPLILLTFGLFYFVLNALLLTFVAFLVPGFSINGFTPALIAAIVLAAANLLWKALSREPSES